jgi:cyclase
LNIIQIKNFLLLINAMKKAVNAEIVASGGAGKLEHFPQAVEAGASILLAASVFHFGTISIPVLKSYLKEKGYNIIS